MVSLRVAHARHGPVDDSFRNNENGPQDRDDLTTALTLAIGNLNRATLPFAELLRLPHLSDELSQDVLTRRRRKLRSMMQVYKTRDRFLGRALFVDPAWHILLDAYASHLDGRRVSVSDACIASGVPYTTALRCLRTLEENELFIRQSDANDRRRAFIVLAPQAIDALETIVDEMVKGA